jgi:hypothetical protein
MGIITRSNRLTKPDLGNTQIGQLCVGLTNRKLLTNGDVAMQAIGQFFKLVNGLQQNYHKTPVLQFANCDKANAPHT